MHDNPVQRKIFTMTEHLQMIMAMAHMATLPYRCQGELTNMLITIKSIDDPRYMRELSPATYGSLLKMGKEEPIAA